MCMHCSNLWDIRYFIKSHFHPAKHLISDRTALFKLRLGALNLFLEYGHKAVIYS